MSDLFQNQQHHGKIIEDSHLRLTDLQNTRFEKCLFPNLTTLEVCNCPAELFVSCFFPELINLRVINSNHRTFISCLFPKISNPFRIGSPTPLSNSGPPGLLRSPSYPELSNSPRQNEKILDDFFSRVANKPIDPTKDVCSLIRSGENQEFRSGVPLTESQIAKKLEEIAPSQSPVKQESSESGSDKEETEQFDMDLDNPSPKPLPIPPLSSPISSDNQAEEKEQSMKGVLFLAGLFSGLGLALIARK